MSREYSFADSPSAKDTDLSDAEWQKIEPLIPSAKPGGRPRSQDLREIANAIFYMVKVGGPWRLLPHDLPSVANSLLQVEPSAGIADTIGSQDCWSSY